MKKIITHFLAVLILAGFLAYPVSAATVSEPKASSPKATEPTKEQINAALHEFNSLSRKEKKERMKEVKTLVKKLKADKKAGRAAGETNKVLLVILALLIPPLAVYLHENEINSKFWISLVLTLLFFIPGVIYALLVVLDAI